MKTYTKFLLATALIAPGALLASAQAQAQTVAVADPEAAVANSKAFTAAQRPDPDQLTRPSSIRPRRAAQRSRRRSRLCMLRLTPTRTARSASRRLKPRNRQSGPNWRRSSRSRPPASRNWRVSKRRPRVRSNMRSSRFHESSTPRCRRRSRKRGVTVLLKPAAALVVQPTADITAAITAELDATVPSVSITPPAGWQPGQQGQQAPAGAAPAAGATPAAPAKKQPQGR